MSKHIPFNGTCKDEYEYQILHFCEVLRNRLINKYRAGRIEHGADQASIDCQKEINLEILDIINYHLIDKANNRLKSST